MAWMRSQVRSLSRPPIFQLAISRRKRKSVPMKSERSQVRSLSRPPLFQFYHLRRKMAGASVPDKSLACRSPIFSNLFQNFGSEAGERIVFHAVTDLNWIAADFTIL